MSQSPLSPVIAMSGAASNSALISFAIYIALVFVIAGLANRAQKGKSFVGEYFLGSRGIGLWAFALTYAATAASGGSFMGFPALIYTHGWSLAWWISGYMIVPLVALGLFAKRINQVARLAGAITVPELLRKRFGNAHVGYVATALVVFFMFFYLLAQFKAGAEIMATLMDGVPVYEAATGWIAVAKEGVPWVGQASADYLLCLIIFAVAVILYTAYGGFRAVVWTDVMQGLVMGVGVVILLVLTLSQVGGLKKATASLAEMTPPEYARALIVTTGDRPATSLRRGDWIASGESGAVRLAEAVVDADHPVEVLAPTSASEIALARKLLVPGYTARITESTPYAHGAGEKGVYLTAPGPSKTSPLGFLPVALAMSFFVFWNFSGAGQPSYMVRQMAFRDTRVLRRSIVLVALFFTLIYFPLVIVFTSARLLLPGMEIHPDRIMPEMAAHVTELAGMPWLAGLLVAAPFAAVMSSVDSFLLLVASGVVRDIYQDSINPNASEERLRRLSHAVTVIVGFLAVLVVLNPPPYLQTLIVFASGGLGASFLMPIVLALYWPRMTADGALFGMITGALTILALYFAGYLVNGSFGEYNLFGLHPIVWSIFATGLVIFSVSLAQRPPDRALIEKFFGR